MRRIVFAIVLLVARAAAAAQPDPPPPPPPLRTLAAETLRALAPSLARSDLALIESEPDGRTRQITLAVWVAAPPETVRAVVLHPEDYPRFMRNVSRSTVERGEGGAIVNRWRIELPIGHFDDAHELRPAPAADGPIDVRSVYEKRRGAFRWEFVRAGRGTVLAHYGRFDGFDDNPLLARLLARNPAYGAGLGLSAGLVLVKAIQREAARRAALRDLAPPRGNAPSFRPLLDRGAVAVLRSDAAGRLVDVSLVERVPARRDVLLDVVRRPDLWPSFLSSVSHVDIAHRDAGGMDFRVGVTAVILDVESLFRLRFVPGGVDALALAGDVRGARYRWDLAPDPAGGTIATYRANHALGQTSGILRLLFRFEPLFEHSGNVAASVIIMRAMAWRAAMLASHASVTR